MDKPLSWIIDIDIPSGRRLDPGIYLPLLLDLFDISDPSRIDPGIRDPNQMDPGADPQDPFLVGSVEDPVDEDPIDTSGGTTVCPKEETPEGEVPVCSS